LAANYGNDIDEIFRWGGLSFAEAANVLLTLSSG